MQTVFDTRLKSWEALIGDKGRYDSGTAHITIDYSTDISMMVDGICAVVSLAAQLEHLFPQPILRRFRHLVRLAAHLQQEIERIARSDRSDKESKNRSLHQQLASLAMDIVLKVYKTKSLFEQQAQPELANRQNIEKLINELEYLLLVILLMAYTLEREFADGETISPEERAFGLFLLHKELIMQGKFPFSIKLNSSGFMIENPIGFAIRSEIEYADCH